MQTVGPRSKAYYDAVPPKIYTGLQKRSPSEENNTSFSLKPFIIEAKQTSENEKTKRSSEGDNKKRSTNNQTPRKKRKSVSNSEPKKIVTQRQSEVLSPNKLLAANI